MCGRYSLTRQDKVAEDLEAALGTGDPHGSLFGDATEWWKPRFNIAPTQPAPVVALRGGRRTVEMMRWGLVPHWAGREGKKPPLMINARRESLNAKAVFRDALQRRRCLVPADGFYEWIRGGKVAQPVYLHLASREIFAFAGLWERVRTEAGELHSFTIITSPSNALVRPIHDRMPVVIDPGAYAAWLDPATSAEAARELLGISPVDDWQAEAVSTHVNRASNDDPACIAPIGPAATVQPAVYD